MDEISKLNQILGFSGVMPKIEVSSESNEADVIYKLSILREVKLFEYLSTEVLYLVAQEAQWREMVKNESIFLEEMSPMVYTSL